MSNTHWKIDLEAVEKKNVNIVPNGPLVGAVWHCKNLEIYRIFDQIKSPIFFAKTSKDKFLCYFGGNPSP